jgi:hypothetical protein
MAVVCLFSWDAVTAIATCALVALGVGTLIYAGVQINDFRKEARVKHLIDLVTQFETEPYASIRRRLGAARTDGTSLKPLDIGYAPPELYDVMNFFEHVGFLLDGNYLDLEGVSVEFHYWILHVWADARELIKKEQAEDDPIYYEFFAKIVNRLLEYDRPRTGKLDLPSAEDVEGFYLEEAHNTVGSPLRRQKRSKRQKN